MALSALQRPTHGFDYLQHIGKIVAGGLVGWMLHCCFCSAKMKVSILELKTSCLAWLGFPALVAECQQETNELGAEVAIMMGSGIKGTNLCSPDFVHCFLQGVGRLQGTFDCHDKEVWNKLHAGQNNHTH